MEKELILKIIKNSLEINSREKNTAFINYSGHVNELDIRIHKKGWKEYQDADYSKDVYMNNRTSEQIQEELLEILKELDKIKELSITDQSHDSSND